METFLIYLFKSSIILSLFYLVYFFLLRKDTFFTLNRHFLLIGILSSILLPFLEFTTIQYLEQPVLQDFIFSSSTVSVHEESLVETEINWWFIGFSSYLLVSTLLLSRFGIQLLSLKKVFTAVSEKTKEGFLFIKTSKDIAPFSFFKYIIFNPGLHQPTELDMIIKHEKVHAKQYHTLDLLIINLVVIFQWINPLVWIYKKALEQNLEFIADQESTRNLSSKKEYQLALVKVCSSNYSSITNNFYQSLIKKRIVMLNKKQSNHKNLWKITVIIPLLCLFLWSFNTKTEIKYIPATPTAEETILPEENAKEIFSSTPEKILSGKEKENVSNSKNIQSSKSVSTLKHNPKISKKNQALAAANTFPSIKKPVTTVSTQTKKKKGTIEFIIHKTSTQEDLDRIKRIFKNEYDVKVTFSNIQRNNDSEITAISVAMNSEKSNANFSIENETPITSIMISYDSKNDKMGIGQSAGKNIWFKNKSGKSGGTVFTINSDDDGGVVFAHKDKKVKGNIFISKSDDDDSNIFIRSSDEGTIFDFDEDSDKEPLFFIDGKEASKKELKKLKSDKIESIEVIKGKKAIKKHGKKAKDGVIDIITKKKARKGTGAKHKKGKNKYPSVLSSKKDNVKIYTKDNVLFVDKNEIRPLVYINGKKVSEIELQKYEVDAIESVHVLKGIAAITKFGEDAENGVVSIITKEK
ncbi:M56 family metallopeptidase [Aquimarina sp. 2201CG5-10]|uniref:M56 family metallopeptidase n=1 Tax=Aquimarina callyspongiae TaxID=3098150 RepID=UPI002AB4136E|nr:M56 family metallopeptidase [Aquimarina sp. 2201CG5-10]MDY8134303.1 M56 family metallopeptidase [Aquimarina sp. 2201CG5-10]